MKSLMQVGLTPKDRNKHLSHKLNPSATEKYDEYPGIKAVVDDLEYTVSKNLSLEKTFLDSWEEDLDNTICL